ncbi:hypothetical protein JCM10212_000933 [Sporobolomyces blumeae]
MLRLTRSTLFQPNARRYWTASTLTSRDPRSLISDRPSHPRPAVTVYALSKHYPQDLLPQLLDSIPTPSIGVLAELDPVHHPPYDVSPHSSTPAPPFSLSIAKFHPPPHVRAIPFKSTLTGRPNISLGREHKPAGSNSVQSQESLDVENEAFEAFLRGGKWAFGDNAGPLASNANSSKQATIDELRDVDPKDVKEIVCFTADRIQPFLAALSAFPESKTLGMMSTSTPFHSSLQQPFTLFYNHERPAGTGAVGVAIVQEASKAPAQRNGASHPTIDYGGMVQFGPTVEVTNARGNIVLTLSSKNAAQLLLSSVQALPSSQGSRPDEFEPSMSNPTQPSTRHISKEKEFYAAIFDSAAAPVGSSSIVEGGDATAAARVDLGKAKLVCRIMAGDPKRGAVSFETEEQVNEGDTVIFLHRPSAELDETEARAPSSATFRFTSVSPSYVSPIPTWPVQSPPSDSSTSVDVEKREGFNAWSENGVVVSRKRANGDGIEVRLAAIEGTSVQA